MKTLLFVIALSGCLAVNLQAQAPQAAQPARGTAGAPAWHPLPADHQKYLDDVLKYWEHTAAKVQRYRCQFERWEYDPTTFSRPTDVASAYSKGDIQFASPDKGLFRVETVWRVAVEQVATQDKNAVVTVPVMKDGKPQYIQEKDLVGEHWVCDGKSVFQFDALNKKLIKRELPPEMQGKQISEGPLPFLFGAKAEEIKDRYWIRVKTPPPEPGHFHLEAIPKRKEEAADFRSVTVVIDEKEFLPTALILEERAGSHTTYKFTDRESNWNMLPQMLNPFHQQFYAPKLPAGWQQVNEPFQGSPGPGPVAAVPGGTPLGPMAPGTNSGPRSANPIGPSMEPRQATATRPAGVGANAPRR